MFILAKNGKPETLLYDRGGNLIGELSVGLLEAENHLDRHGPERAILVEIKELIERLKKEKK